MFQIDDIVEWIIRDGEKIVIRVTSVTENTFGGILLEYTCARTMVGKYDEGWKTGYFIVKFNSVSYMENKFNQSIDILKSCLEMEI